MATSPPTSLEAKLVVLGSQGVGKTSLVHRYVKKAFIPPNKVQSTVGASFLTTRVSDPESGAIIRLQIWDTAGQERFRSISRLYYRGAHAAILCYDVTSKKSFEDMGAWLKELKENCGVQSHEDLIIHVVGTKSDVASQDPKKREVPFERCIGYVAEQLYPEIAGMPGLNSSYASPPNSHHGLPLPPGMASPNSNRSSGFWGQEAIWDCCHEISAKDGEGIEEVFRVVTRKLVEQNIRRLERQRLLEESISRGRTPGVDGSSPGYFDIPNNGTGSFRVGHGDKRRSWLGFPATPGALSNWTGDEGDEPVEETRRKGRCC
ncbi:ras-domain-containing protein [Hortaea werneckii]|nr:ras-domain-containing protein [Hortaea werneckii]